MTFSGDKLLGGPQAGVWCGRRELIAKLAKIRFKRALRCDKLTLAALAATLRLYLRAGDLAATLPTLLYLSRTVGELELVAERARETWPSVSTRISASRLCPRFRKSDRVRSRPKKFPPVPSASLILSLRPRRLPRCSARLAHPSSDVSRTTPSCSTCERWTMQRRSRYRFLPHGRKQARPPRCGIWGVSETWS